MPGALRRGVQVCQISDRARAARCVAGKARSYRVLDREAVYPEQFLDAALRVEPLLVGLARLITVGLVPLGVAVDVGNRARQRGWIAGAQQDAIDSRGDE